MRKVVRGILWLIKGTMLIFCITLLVLWVQSYWGENWISHESVSESDGWGNAGSALLAERTRMGAGGVVLVVRIRPAGHAGAGWGLAGKLSGMWEGRPLTRRSHRTNHVPSSCGPLASTELTPDLDSSRYRRTILDVPIDPGVC